MLVREHGCNPDDSFRSKMCGVGQSFTKVIMVCLRQLVLDYYVVAGSGIPGQDVSSERAAGDFCPFGFQLDADGSTELSDTLTRGEPWSKVSRLVRPHLAELDGAQYSQSLFNTHVSP